MPSKNKPENRYKPSPRPYGTRGATGTADLGVRQVAPTFGKTLFLTYGDKAAGHIAVESDAERLVAHMLTVDPRVKHFRPQPFTVDLINQRIHTTREAVSYARAQHKQRMGAKFYTPDFLVGWHGALESVLEVKLEGFEGDDEYQMKLHLGQQILALHGYLFSKVVVPSSPKHPLRNNVLLLSKALSRQDLFPADELALAIQDLCTPVGAQVDAVCKALKQSPSLAPVWLVSGLVASDLASHPICGSMLLVPAHGDLTHLQLLAV